MNAKQKHVKHQIFALLRESELTDDQLDDLVFEWKMKVSMERTNLIQHEINTRKEHAFI
ncbi:hypothetical protein GY03_18860 [Proteus vulgaris]|uniref:hypothetical protein n=1 Tax=Proteus vulgaris TaxID=585 RepID=UPI0021B11CE3|nr:hypothetical protein [Proteus vulgaris]MCT6519338.1 hypothetical protein [Proteus vulgaris]